MVKNSMIYIYSRIEEKKVYCTYVHGQLELQPIRRKCNYT